MTDKMLVTVDQVNPLEIFVDGKYLELLKFIKKESTIEKPDVSTAKGRALIKSMSAQVASSKVFILKGGKKLADNEKKKIADTLEKMNTSRKFIEDCLVYRKAEVREPLTKYEEEKKAEEEKERLAQEEKERLEKEAEQKRIDDEKVENEKEKKRLEKERMQLEADKNAISNAGSASSHIVNSAIKGQGAAEAETERLKQKGIDDEKQAKIDQENAVEAERVRVQKIADDKEAKRLDDERIQREADEAKAADKTHRKEINNQALAGLVEVLKVNDSLPDVDDIGKQVIIAIIQGKIPNVSIKY